MFFPERHLNPREILVRPASAGFFLQRFMPLAHLKVCAASACWGSPAARRATYQGLTSVQAQPSPAPATEGWKRPKSCMPRRRGLARHLPMHPPDLAPTSAARMTSRECGRVGQAARSSRGRIERKLKRRLNRYWTSARYRWAYRWKSKE